MYPFELDTQDENYWSACNIHQNPARNRIFFQWYISYHFALYRGLSFFLFLFFLKPTMLILAYCVWWRFHTKSLTINLQPSSLHTVQLSVFIVLCCVVVVMFFSLFSPFTLTFYLFYLLLLISLLCIAVMPLQFDWRCLDCNRISVPCFIVLYLSIFLFIFLFVFLFVFLFYYIMMYDAYVIVKNRIFFNYHHQFFL